MMATRGRGAPHKRPRTHLSLSDRLLESLWGILIVLSVTGSAELWIGATAREVFVIGFVTAFAWGVVEAVMDLLRRRLERTRQVGLIARAAASAEGAETELAEALRDTPIEHLAAEDRAALRTAILNAAKRAPAPDRRLPRKDLVTSVETGVVLWASTLPVLAPFAFLEDGATALAASQAVAVSILFALGAAWGRYSGQSPLRTGIVMAALGLGLAGLLRFFQA